MENLAKLIKEKNNPEAMAIVIKSMWFTLNRMPFIISNGKDRERVQKQLNKRLKSFDKIARGDYTAIEEK